VYKPLGASLYSFAYHGLCAFIFGNTCSLCLSISPSTMDLETMIHAEIESEDETQNHLSSDRRPCTQNVTCPWMYTPNQQLKNNKTRCRACRTVGNLDIELIWLRASVLVAGCWLVFLVLGIFTDLSLGRFDCVDFIHTHHL